MKSRMFFTSNSVSFQRGTHTHIQTYIIHIIISGLKAVRCFNSSSRVAFEPYYCTLCAIKKQPKFHVYRTTHDSIVVVRMA